MIKNGIRMLITLVVASALVCVLYGCGGGEPKKDGPQQTEVKIGLIGPLTGDMAAMGQGMKNAAALAIEEANLREDVKAKNLVFKLFAVDDRAEPKEAVNGANQLISDPGVIGVVGHLNSGCSMPASAIYARKDLVMISPASTNPALTMQKLKNVFRVCTTDNVQGTYAADYVFKNKGITKVSIIHDKTPYGQGLSEEFEKQFVANGGEVLSFEGIAIGDKDFKALLTKIKQKKPELIYFGGVYQEGGLLIKQAKELEIPAGFMGGDALNSDQVIAIGGSATEGTLVSMVGAPPEEIPSAQKFIDAYKAKYPDVSIQPYDAYTYDATSMIIESVINAGADKTAVMEYIRTIKYSGVIGETQFDEKGDTLNKIITVYVITEGKFVPVE